MGRHRAGVKMDRKKVSTLFSFCAAFLLLVSGICSAEIAVSFPRPLPSPGLTYPGGVDAPHRHTVANSILVAQQKGVLPQKTTQDAVIINGARLADESIKTLEKQYRVRILPGDYWYDRICGAWGFRGGPAAGFILPFIDLGGPLPANASNGTTGVFINGRELHVLDVVALQQITPVYQGRYWVDAQGNIGLEGGPALINLLALANARGVKREGILSTYDKTGAVVIGY